MTTASVWLTASGDTSTLPSQSIDPAMGAWERGLSVDDVPRELLLAHARSKVERLMNLSYGWDGHRGSPVTPIAAMAANGVMLRLLFDGAATPQVVPLPDGGLQVEWLVDGNSLVIHVDSAAEVTVLATAADGTEIVDGDFLAARPDMFTLDQAKRFLEKMSPHVRVRVC